MKEVRERKQIAYRVHLELRQLLFDFKYVWGIFDGLCFIAIRTNYPSATILVASLLGKLMRVSMELDDLILA